MENTGSGNSRRELESCSPVAFDTGFLRFGNRRAILIAFLVPFATLHHLRDAARSMLRKQFVRKRTLLVANGCDNIFGLLRHLVEESIGHSNRAISDVVALLRAKLVCTTNEMGTDQRERDYITRLSWKL